MAPSNAKSGRQVDPTLRPDSRLAFRRQVRQTHVMHPTQVVIFADEGHLETVHLSDNCSDEYQNLYNADETGSESEIDVDASALSQGTISGLHHRSQPSRRQGNGQQPLVRISTTSGSQEVLLIRWTPANCGHIIRGTAYSPPTFLSSGVRYSSPVATNSGTTSGVSSSSPVGEPCTPRPGRPRQETDSQHNTVTGGQGTILEQAMALMLLYTPVTGLFLSNENTIGPAIDLLALVLREA